MGGDFDTRYAHRARHRQRPPLASALVAAALALGACSASPRPVDIRLFSFKPSPLDVAAGETVRWTQHDNTTHTVTSGVPAGPDGRFESGPLGRSEAFAFTFERQGDFPYFCSIHESMRGEVRVD